MNAGAIVSTDTVAKAARGSAPVQLGAANLNCREVVKMSVDLPTLLKTERHPRGRGRGCTCVCGEGEERMGGNLKCRTRESMKNAKFLMRKKKIHSKTWRSGVGAAICQTGLL